MGPTLEQQARAASKPPVRHCGTLVMLKGPDPGAIQALGEQPLVLGRGMDATWRIEVDDVSRRHAQLFRMGDMFFVEDLGSANGTYVHGQRVQARRPVQAGDRIHLGARVLLRFDTHDAYERDVLARLYQSAVRDPLTGAYNRRYFEERLRGEASYAMRHDEDLALVMLDVDHFKTINDHHGHPTGDVVLRSIVSVVQNMIRPEDLLARYGGEELCILARGLSLQGACALAERVRRAVAGTRARTDDGQTLSATLSGGVALLRHESPAGAAERLLQDADEALYCAKRKGRNRVCLTDPG